MAKFNFGSKYLIFVLLSTFLTLVSCGGDAVTLKESDHAMFFLSKNDNGNQVIYAVATDGECGITKVFPYWKMEDGSVEDLLSREEPLYGVENLSKQSNGSWTFTVAKLPSKTITAQVVESVTTVDGKSEKNCSFIGVTDISTERAVITEVKVDNDGWNVRGIDIYGLSLATKEKVHEYIAN